MVKEAIAKLMGDGEGEAKPMDWFAFGAKLTSQAIVNGLAVLLVWVIISWGKAELDHGRATFERTIERLEIGRQAQHDKFDARLDQNTKATEKLDNSVRDLTNELKRRPTGAGPGGL